MRRKQHNMKLRLIVFFILVSLLPRQRIMAENVVEIKYSSTARTQIKMSNTRYIILCVVNLYGKTLTMPEGCTLEFSEGGQITNGLLTGDHTKIEGKTKGIFYRTHISGTFDVPTISTNMFSDATYENTLKNVMALACSDVQNTVTIEALPDGEVYEVSTSEGYNIIHVPSNTDVIIDGTVQLAPNNEESYSIFHCDNVENVSFSGNGCIIGDRTTHIGTSGEWGMGINIVGSRNIHITGLTISDCWGDCIYVGRGSNKKESSDVTIDHCLLTGSRRQGISVVACYGSLMEDLEIRDIHGTDPQAAIDIEPNSGDTCTGAWIKNVCARNCYHGIISTTPGDAISKITDIHIENCDIESEVLGLSASNCDLFDVKDTHVLTEYSGLRTHISTVRLDNCYFGPYEGKELESDIIVLWDVFLDVRNSEFHGNKFIDNPKATPASKRMIIAGNQIYCPVELKIQASQIIGNTVYSQQTPIMSLILGEANAITDNTLIYTGEDHPTNLLEVKTDNNTIENNTFVYQPTCIPRLHSAAPDLRFGTDVYTLDGRLYQHGSALSRLPHGSYIIGNRKVVVR